MRRIILLCGCVLMFLWTLFCQTQTEFVIGAEWLNRVEGPWQPPSQQDWLNIQDLGLNWGAVNLNYNDDAYARQALSDAHAHGVKLILNRFAFQNTQGPANGQRWEYHPEWPPHYAGAETGSAVIDADAKRYADDTAHSSTNAWRVRTGPEPPGYIATNLQLSNEQGDGTLYYVKVRMRLDATVFPHTPVVTVKAVRLTDNYERTMTIYADSFSNINYKEITAFSFFKSATGPFDAPDSQAYYRSLHPFPLPDSSHPAGVPYTPRPNTTYTPFDYRVYWHGNVTCYLDYVIIDDNDAHLGFTGQKDENIAHEVNLWKDSAALGKYFVRDGPWYTNWLCLGYIERKTRSIVIPAGYPSKTGLSENIGYVWGDLQPQRLVRRNIVQTEHIQTSTDIYPIAPVPIVPLPNDPDYNQKLQSRLQDNLILYLGWYITAANQFAIPFWFIPQADLWDDPVPGNRLREPTVWELRTMVNLGAAYGAKGINYFLYYSGNVPPYAFLGLVERDGTPRRTIYRGTAYAADKWEMVKSINRQLASLGPTLARLTWVEAFSMHLQPSLFGKIITGVTASGPSGSPYVELAFFRDSLSPNTPNYFMVVNRLSGPYDTSDVQLTTGTSLPYANLLVTDVYTGREWVVARGHSFTDRFQPGEGKLYKISNGLGMVTTISGWQMLSVPVVVPNYQKTVVWPRAASPASEYVPNIGYVVKDTLKNGPGYWVKFDSALVVKMVGNRIDNLSAPVSAGWNLVGSISDPIPVSTNLCLFPAGNAFTSQFFTYKNGYVRVDSIIPGIGLWVKVQSAGSILMNSSPIQCDAPSAISEDGLDHFIITDSQGKKQDLYVANLDLDPSLGQTDLSMPPPFPEAGFDARFEDGEFIKPVSPDSGIVQLVINVEAQAYPVTVNWELNPANGIEYSITSEGMGKQPSGQHLSRAGSTTMTTLSGGKLRLGVQASHSGQQTIPKAYVLAQNYPNPFNPTTEIRFGLPDAGTVSLVVYDVLGRKVAELANGYHAAGYHNATWNAVGAASGVYFARFSVTSTAGAVAYTKVNKLMLIR